MNKLTKIQLNIWSHGHMNKEAKKQRNEETKKRRKQKKEKERRGE